MFLNLSVNDGLSSLKQVGSETSPGPCWPLTNHIVPREVSITCIMRNGATNNQVTEAPNVLMAPEE